MTSLVDIFANPTILLALKISVLILLGIYNIFSFVVLKQVVLMNKTFQTSYGTLFRMMALVHLVAVTLVFLFAFIIL
ncbi:hypothetical protein HYV31_02890 [candidate division WWE3 bacterium]|nr:hypothetical protein [candidate division WWE3 bacterium]